jgi:hypothetical protein
VPGIVGIVGATANGSRVRAALQSLTHFDTYRSKELSVGTGAALGQVWRDGDRSGTDWHVDSGSGAAALLNGTAFSMGSTPRRVDARFILERYLRGDVFDPRELDGAFVLVLADPRSRFVHVFNDRIGTLPVYYTTAEAGGVAFAPEAKALFAAGAVEPRLSRTGIVTFLNCGYCLGKTTLFDQVQFLEPGSSLAISMVSGDVDVRRYWKIVYEPARALRTRRAAEAALHDVTRRAHMQIVEDSRNGYDLMLSGGWDSRGILAFLDSIGKPPRKAIAWGRTKDIPLSDPQLASHLAERFRLPLQFVSYDTDQFCANAASWCRLSELANDNIGWFAEGASVLAASYRTDADFTLVGDEAWGWHGHPRTERQVREANMPASLGAEVGACLDPAEREEHRVAYEAQVDHVLAPCENEHPLDRRDFLYLHGRVARFIFALGYYKELAVEVRRPFLLGSVLDVMAQVPGRFRVDKNLYISMFDRYFPALAAIPTRSARSLPEWSRDIRTKPELRRFFLDLLDESRLDGALGAVLDPAAVARVRQAFFDGPVQPPRPEAPQPSTARHLPLRLRQRIRASGWYPGSSNMAGSYPARGRADIVRCIALLSLLQRSLPALAARAEPAQSEDLRPAARAEAAPV